MNKYDEIMKNGIDSKETIQYLYHTFEKISKISLIECVEKSLDVLYKYTNEFDYKKYLLMYPDLNKSGITTENEAYNHWIQCGKNEGRCAVIIGSNESYLGFEWESYISINPDLKDIGITNEKNAYLHWCTVGRHYNIKVTNNTSINKKTTTYVIIRINEDVKIFKDDQYNKKWVKILQDDINTNLNWEYYIGKYEDLSKSGINNYYDTLLHWLIHGKMEGRYGKKSLDEIKKEELLNIKNTKNHQETPVNKPEVNKKTLPMYIINLEERIDKKMDMINQLKQIGYTEYKFFKASNKNTPIVKQKYDYYENAFEKKTIRTVPMFYKSESSRKVIQSIGAVGLIQSTIELFKQIEQEGQEHVIICEDDAQFHKSFKYMLKPIRLHMYDTDIVYLGYNSHIAIINQQVVNDDSKIIEQIPKNGELNIIYGTYGYICSSKFRLKIIELGIDWFISNNCTIDYGYNVLYRDGILTGAIPTGEHLIIPDVFDEEAINWNRKNKETFYSDRSIQLLNYHPQITHLHTFVFIIPSYNNEKWISKNLGSIFEQTYKKWRIIYVNDCSTDDTHNSFIKLTTEISSEYPNKITYINNTKKYGQSFNRYCAYNMCDDNEICIMLDGDDWLSSKYVLSYLNKFMVFYDVDMTYGRFEVFLNGKNSNFNMPGEYPQSVIEKRNYRADSWRACHLRVMKAALLKQIRPTDFLDENNDFIICSTDMVESFACLELSKGRHKLITETLMVYNKENSIIFVDTSHYSNVNKDKKVAIQKAVRNLPKYTLEPDKNDIAIVNVDDPLFKTLIYIYRNTLFDKYDLFLCNTENIHKFIHRFNKYKDVVFM